MARIFFGQSRCQIEGMFVPVADMNLAAGESVYFAHHVMLWKDPSVALSRVPFRGAWRRLLARLPLVMAQAQGPGHVAFSRDAPGETIAVPLDADRAIDVRPHAFLVASSTVLYDWFWTGIWFSPIGDPTVYPAGRIMDRFMAPATPGLLLLHAAGNVFLRRLEAQQSFLVKPQTLLFKDSSVTMQLHIEEVRPKGALTRQTWPWLRRCAWLRMTGPGRVAIQSAYPKVEYDGDPRLSSSPATYQSWKRSARP
jgi:uncharacterized protein (AIM24 family)